MLGQRKISAYVHVPYCLRRCGYCDFNTYANLRLGPGVDGYADAVISELRLADTVLHRAGAANWAGPEAGGRPSPGTDGRPSPEVQREPRPGLQPSPKPTSPPTSQPASQPASRGLDTVFFGGGTPTVLSAADLGRILAQLRRIYGLSRGAEVTTEANPDTVGARYLEALARAGFTRISFGMQSAVGHVLRTLDRTHTQANLEAGVRAAQALGLQVSVDLIYGTPGESLQDWRDSLQAALDLGVEHISAYALVIEPNTAMGRALRHGQIAATDPDDQADKYELADAVLGAAGLECYEISNWAKPGRECRHNLNYWANHDWLGFGPGAHSHLEFGAGGVGGGAAALAGADSGRGLRFWNLKSPLRWAAAVEAGWQGLEDGAGVNVPVADAAGGDPGEAVGLGGSVQDEVPAWLRVLPLEDAEVLDGESAWLETVMLQIRLREGLVLAAFEQLHPGLIATARELADEGLLDSAALSGPGGPRAVLTLRGRLLADAVTRRLTDIP